MKDAMADKYELAVSVRLPTMFLVSGLSLLHFPSFIMLALVSDFAWILSLSLRLKMPKKS